MNLHSKIMNITVEKRKQNLAIDGAIKTHKNLKDIFVAIYARGHRDARHAAAEAANESGAADVRPYCRNHEIYYDFELGCPACTSRR